MAAVATSFDPDRLPSLVRSTVFDRDQTGIAFNCFTNSHTETLNT